MLGEIKLQAKEEKLFNYFYKITNLINGKFYYGIRSANSLSKDTKYMGSGKAIKEAIKKYGIENFKKEIIVHYSTRKEVASHEQMVVDLEMINDPFCYNIKLGGDADYKITNEVRQKISDAGIGRVPWNKGLTKETDDRVLNYSIENSGENHWNFGGTTSDYQKQRSSETHLGRVVSLETRIKISESTKGENAHFFGKTHPTEIKQQISESVKEYYKDKPRWNTGQNKETNESCRKISESLSGKNHPNFGIHLSEQTRLNISKGNKGKIRTPEMIETMRSCHPKSRRCSINGIEYRSISDAIRQLNIKGDIKKKFNSNDLEFIEWFFID